MKNLYGRAFDVVARVHRRQSGNGFQVCFILPKNIGRGLAHAIIPTKTVISEDIFVGDTINARIMDFLDRDTPYLVTKIHDHFPMLHPPTEFENFETLFAPAP